MGSKLNLTLILLLVFLVPYSAFSQVYSTKDIVNQYDPFTITINDLSLNTNDDDFREHAYTLIMTIIAGNEKIIKFINRDDLIMNSVISYDDFSNVNFTVKRNNTVIVPALINLTNTPSAVTIRLEGYSNVNPGDQQMLSQLSSSFCYTSSTMYSLMDQAFKFLANSPDVNRPDNNQIVTADILQQNMGKRPDVFYMGDPAEITYVVPKDPQNVIGTNILVQGPKSIESKVSVKVADKWNVTITKLTDVKIVKSQPYYPKILALFTDITALHSIPDLKEPGYLERCNEVINSDLVMGRNYINDQVIKQFTNLMNFLKAGIRVKSDTNETTEDFMKSEEREALSYIENNLKSNDFNLNNEYVYDDYINSSVNRGTLQKEVDLIRRYYQIK
jgi:hypothetical protein